MALIAGNQSNADRAFGTDLYPTPPEWTRVLLRIVDLPGPIWEPAVGHGDMADVLRETGHEVTETDIVTGTDFLKTDMPHPSVVTNPPYRMIDDFVIHGLNQATEVLALLVGWHIFGGARRADAIWKRYPPSLVAIIPQRMKVFGKPSQFNHAWVVWAKQESSTFTRLTWEHI